MYFSKKEIEKKYNSLVKEYNKEAFKFCDLATFIGYKCDGTQLMYEVLKHAEKDLY